MRDLSGVSGIELVGNACCVAVLLNFAWFCFVLFWCVKAVGSGMETLGVVPTV